VGDADPLVRSGENPGLLGPVQQIEELRMQRGFTAGKLEDLDPPFRSMTPWMRHCNPPMDGVHYTTRLGANRRMSDS
jgi:hypothetical protein